jgi:hypothetical protein
MKMDKDSKLYKKIRKLADEKFSKKTSLYKSFWIVHQYKKAVKSKMQKGGGKSQFDGHYSGILVKVHQNLKKAAQYAFKLQKLGFKGGQSTGWKRAKQLATKSEISIKDLRYIRSFFARHVYTSYPTFKKWINAGKPKTDSYWYNKHSIIAIYIWGGPAAIKWVNTMTNLKLLNKTYPGKDYKKINF